LTPRRKVLLATFSHRFLAIARWELGLLRTRIAAAARGQKARIRRRVADAQRPLLLNLGSGPRGRADAHWINVDGVADQNVDYLLDLARPTPFPDGAFDGVFCEHVLEHFTQEDGEAIAREVARILVPGGWFRVIVPDAELVMRTYFDAPEKLVSYREAHTAMEAVNSFFHQRYEHQFLYDWATMRLMLGGVGFEDVSRRAFGQGARPDLLIDDAKYAWESLYVEARKPSAAAMTQDAASVGPDVVRGQAGK
jgi:predicted SAM-dependent methyltransferase